MHFIHDIAALTPGNWYAVGIENLDGEINWGGMPIHKYEGDGQWSDDYREPVEEVWDAGIQMSVSINAADAYMVQS